MYNFEELKLKKRRLQGRQNLLLEEKIKLTEARIIEWYNYWGGEVYVAFSGGKDSTVLLHIVRSLFRDVPAVFCDTGLEYPEIREFVKTFDNTVWLKPKMAFYKVIEKYGYPVVSKRQAMSIEALQHANPNNKATVNLILTGMNRKGVYCPSFKLPKKWLPLVNSGFKVSEKCCDIMKKNPSHKYGKNTGRKSIIGVMASDSYFRERRYLDTGCNSFKSTTNITSTPLAFWLEKDIWDYIKKYNIPYSTIYDKGFHRTGCMFCMFGVHLEKEPNRFQKMKLTHPKQYEYCINKLGCGKVLDFIGVKY